MTQDVALRQLPALEPELEDLHPGLKGFIYMYARDYARACVSSATEALRAERDLFRAETIALAKDAERLAEALQEAREYVVSELADERAKFAGYEHCSTIASIEADLAKIDAALEQEAGRG